MEVVPAQPMTWLDFLADESVSFDDRLDRWEAFVANLPPQECPLTHTFPDGMYVREIFMPAGSVVTSRIHKFDNPFFITKPGTRRVLLIHEDTVWTTVHLNLDNKRDPEELLNDLTYVRQNQYLPCHS